jgi:PAS domain S-box-containing protein
MLEDILDSIDDPVYVLNNKGGFIFANKALIEVTGYSRRELLEFNAIELVKDGVIDHSVTKTVLKSRNKVIGCQHVKKKNSLVNSLMITSSPIFDAKGDVKYLVGVLKNISEINEIYREAVLKNEVSVFKHKDYEDNQTVVKDIIAESSEMKKLLDMVAKLASYDTSLLILGESGTGKEVIASFVHNVSPRSEKTMIKINCASLPENLLETELFGYEKGSFTGASDKGKIGLIEMAHNGTLFLDEIDSLPILLQAKILRAIETKMIKRIGSVKEKYIDFRLITATNADLNELVKEKKFRQDLYFRLNVVPVKIPALRERPYDIIPLAIYFLKYYCSKYNKNKQFSKKVFDSLIEYEWPGNVRELKNFVERMVVMSLTSVIELTDVPKGILEDFSIKENDTAFISKDMDYDTGKNDTNYLFDIENNSYKELMARYEEELIKHALLKYKSTYKTAEILGINQSTVFRKKKKYEEQ